MKVKCARCGVKFLIYRDEIKREHCEPCIDKMEEDRILDESISLLERELSPDHLPKFRSWDLKKKRDFVNNLWDFGLIKFVGVRPEIRK